MADVVKRVSYDICLEPNEIRALMGIIHTGIKNSPPTGYDMKKAAPVIEKLTTYLKTFGKDTLEQEQTDIGPEMVG
jgi:hypothetical protein